MIDRYDIAAIALVDGDHDEQSLRLSGSQSLLPAERVEILGDVLGRMLRFEAQGEDEAPAEMMAGMPPEYVNAFFSFYADGTLDEAEPLSTVQEITGAVPRPFRQWAIAHASEFS